MLCRHASSSAETLSCWAEESAERTPLRGRDAVSTGFVTATSAKHAFHVYSLFRSQIVDEERSVSSQVDTQVGDVRLLMVGKHKKAKP